MSVLKATATGPVPDESLDRFARLATAALGTPAALISMITAEGQVVPGAVGLPEPWQSRRLLPLTHSLCRLVADRGEPVAVPDLGADPDLAGSPAATELGVAAWLGVPLRATPALPDGSTAAPVEGVVCVIDHRPREWSAADTAVLSDIAAACSVQLRLRSLQDADGAVDGEVRVAEAGRLAAEAAQLQAETAQHLSETSHRATETALARAELAERRARLLLWLSESLSDARTIADVGAVLSELGTVELGATWVGVRMLSRDRTALTYLDFSTLPADTDRAWQSVPIDAALPSATAVRNRRLIAFASSQELHEQFPAAGTIAALPTMGASAYVPLLVGPAAVGVLTLIWDHARPSSRRDRLLWQAVARYAGQALQRTQLAAERRSSAEILQRSLLTELPEPDHLELRARYVPAAQEEQIGGDWYDALILPDGATTLVIGDVAGHDIAAAARMGQLRGLLRAFAWDRQEPPGGIVGRLDSALDGLRIDATATLILARIEQDPDHAAAGLRRLRWTNAGHPPPVLLHGDGRTQVLDTEPDLLVGLAAGTDRRDHTHVLPPGCTLLLYTDGLIEHRGRHLDAGIADLLTALRRHAGEPLDRLLDAVVGELIGPHPDDDCALLAVRAHPEDRPRPAEAGPNTH